MKGTTVVLRKGPYDSLEKVEFLQTLAYGLLETLADLLLMVYDLMEIGEVLVTLVSDLLETMAHLDLSVYYLMETLVSPEKVGLHLEPDCYLEELPTTHNCLFFALQLQPSALVVRSLCLLGLSYHQLLANRIHFDIEDLYLTHCLHWTLRESSQESFAEASVK